MSHALPLYRAAAVRAIERAAFARGVDAATLIQRAGRSAADLLRERWPMATRVGVLCGTGNNGGDGYVAASALHEAGLEVFVAASGDPGTDEAKAAQAAWRALGCGVIALGGPLPRVDVWIDALFGVGLSRPPAGALSDAIARIQSQQVPVLALDLPSGVDADTGAVAGAVLPASVTLSFIAAKQGLYTGQGVQAAGEVLIDALDLPAELFTSAPRVAGAPAALAVARPALRGVLPRRSIDSHKGHHGRVVCVGGDEGMGGALVLCAEAAVRAGAGWVEALSRAATVQALNARRPEVMARLADEIDDRFASASVIALGPGLGTAEWGRDLFQKGLASGRPLVLDADALNLLAESPRPLPLAVLTPHPGEAGRLWGKSSTEVQADRFGSAQQLAERYEAVVVLKGAGTIVAAPGETPRVIQAGNPGMASGGMGDALTGVIAALRAQGLAPFEAAWAGALAHAVTGDIAAGRHPRGLLATDVIDALREVLNP